MPITTYGNPILRRKADPVGKIDAEIKQVCESMVEAMIRANGVGLAAPQIGVPRRIIVLDLAIDPENPAIMYAGTEGGDSTTGGVFKSLDGAANWSPYNTGMTNFIAKDVEIAPLVAPEKRPSVKSATLSSSPMPDNMEVGVSISRIPGPPLGPS